ncbi:Integrase core domain-containing protein [Pelagirhabdus alkalitolerans]|uniref:Integrase core domain-containing protein n=1 Tax=Pelagirhabdus alkalitolerans TaxID=1612202 RepID=A0A1G6MYE5_9BACI|nr:Integrase core domain-containing protein [Pelagirhabdus alkalitolerans]
MRFVLKQGLIVISNSYHNEIISHSSGRRKGAVLVHRVFASVQENLYDFQMFHTDRGSEFKNVLIDEVLHTFNKERLLSHKGTPYDNALTESTFKTIKIEFVKGTHFTDQHEIDLELFDFVYWFNYMRIHRSLDYLSPIEYKLKDRNVLSSLVLAYHCVES